MTAAVDTSVLFDVLLPNVAHVRNSGTALEDAGATGSLLICEVAVAEVRPYFDTDGALISFMERSGIEFRKISMEGATLAGKLWGDYRRRGSRTRRSVADFLIAAHAMTEAHRLLTRNADFRQLPLDDLEVIEPGV